MVEKGATGGGQFDAVHAAAHQLNANLLFQVSDFATAGRLRRVLLLLGLVPDLRLPRFGLSGLLPQLMGAGSYLIVCWVRHNGASIGKHGPSQPGRGFRSAKAVPGRAYSSQPINQCELLMDVPAGTNRI